MADSPQQVRIAAMADMHYGKTGDSMRPTFTATAERSDVMLLCGDLTDYGLPEEAKRLAADLAAIKTPILAILGNHDYESGQADVVSQILTDAGVHMLDGQAIEILGVGFAGAKGFGGGFGKHTLEPWGEPAIKAFVQEAIDEGVKLERALSRLRTPQRIAMLHYAPIEATVEGEPPAIYPFLGSSRLEEPLHRYSVTTVFHGHAHRGQPEGHTRDGIAVYNVSMPLMRRAKPDELPVKFIEVEVDHRGERKLKAES